MLLAVAPEKRGQTNPSFLEIVMLAKFRSNCQTNLIPVTFTLLALLLVRAETLADEALISAENPWIAMECPAQSLQVQIRHDLPRSYELNRPTFVITHGMGGTETGDRFHQLADEAESWRSILRMMRAVTRHRIFALVLM